MEDFGMFNSLLSLSAIVSVPRHRIVGNGKVRLKFSALQNTGKIKYLFYNTYIKLLLAGSIGISIFIFLSGYIGSFLNIHTQTCLSSS